MAHKNISSATVLNEKPRSRELKLVISTACEETGLGTVGMQQSRSLANQKPSLNNRVTKFVTASDNLC